MLTHVLQSGDLGLDEVPGMGIVCKCYLPAPRATPYAMIYNLGPVPKPRLPISAGLDVVILSDRPWLELHF